MSGAIVGAIRFDAWYLNASSSAISIAQLGPTPFQYRAPWFFNTYPNASLVDGAGDRQLVIDREIGYAAAAGLKFWAFNQHAANSTLSIAWNFYQQSSIKSQINWCWIADVPTFESFSASQYVTWFQQTNYQTVLSGRPLIFILGSGSDNYSTLATAITATRSACTTASVPNPYFVIMRGDPPTAFSNMQTAGADAVGAYNSNGIPTGSPSTYASLDSGTQNFWITMAATTAPIVPICQMGWDVRPLTYPTPPTSPPGWVTPGTVAERTSHIQAGVNYVNTNPTICPAKVLLVYSWTECSEGGGALIPTIGDPPIGPPPALNSILTSIAPIIT